VDVLTAVVAMVGLALAGASAGLFFTFSNSVMPGLDAIRPEAAISTMTSINRKILNPLFLLVYVGSTLITLVAGVLLLSLDTGAAWLFFAAVAVYFLGVIAPTARVNVPLNNALDTTPIPDDEAEAARMWSDYSTRWTRWNHWRAVFSLATLVLMGVGLLIWELR
jgi:uncharacterized membrane protein